MMGRLHVTPTTAASSTTVKAPTPPRIKRPRRSRVLSGTASALGLPRFADKPFSDVALELAEVVFAAPDLGGAKVLDRGVVLPRDVAEVLDRALVGPGQPRLVLRDGLGRPHQRALERDAVVEVERRRGGPRARVGLPVALQQDIARVLDLGRLVDERPALVVALADELLVVFDVRLHVGEKTRLLVQDPIEDLIDQAAVFGLLRLVERPSRTELAIELAVAGVRVIEPVALVRGEDAEDDREHDQDPRKDIVEADRIAREALPGKAGCSPLVEVGGDMRQRRAARRRPLRLCLYDVVGGDAIVGG